jgi:hypothetical protein
VLYLRILLLLGAQLSFAHDGNRCYRQMVFVTRDLHHPIIQLYLEQFSKRYQPEPFTVCSSQDLSNTNFDKIRNYMMDRYLLATKAAALLLP